VTSGVRRVAGVPGKGGDHDVHRPPGRQQTGRARRAAFRRPSAGHVATAGPVPNRPRRRDRPGGRGSCGRGRTRPGGGRPSARRRSRMTSQHDRNGRRCRRGDDPDRRADGAGWRCLPVRRGTGGDNPVGAAAFGLLERAVGHVEHLGDVGDLPGGHGQGHAHRHPQRAGRRGDGIGGDRVVQPVGGAGVPAGGPRCAPGRRPAIRRQIRPTVCAARLKEGTIESAMKIAAVGTMASPVPESSVESRGRALNSARQRTVGRTDASGHSETRRRPPVCSAQRTHTARSSRTPACACSKPGRTRTSSSPNRRATPAPPTGYTACRCSPSNRTTSCTGRAARLRRRPRWRIE